MLMQREEPRLDPNNLDDRANEQPLIVTLNPGDLTAEEVDAIAAPPLLSQDGVNTCRDLPSSSSPAAQDSSTILENKKILFKQPSKRPAAEETNGAEAGKEKEVRRQKPESAMKKVSDSRLLSFADSEDG